MLYTIVEPNTQPLVQPYIELRPEDYIIIILAFGLTYYNKILVYANNICTYWMNVLLNEVFTLNNRISLADITLFQRDITVSAKSYDEVTSLMAARQYADINLVDVLRIVITQPSPVFRQSFQPRLLHIYRRCSGLISFVSFARLIDIAIPYGGMCAYLLLPHRGVKTYNYIICDHVVILDGILFWVLMESTRTYIIPYCVYMSVYYLDLADAPYDYMRIVRWYLQHWIDIICLTLGCVVLNQHHMFIASTHLWYGLYTVLLCA